MSIPLTRRLLCVLAVSMSGAGVAQAQALPSTLRIVVGYPPGGTNDVLARLVGTALNKQFNTNVVVENLPGASGVLAQNKVIASPADGATVLLGSINDVLADALSGTQKVQQSFTAVGGIASVPSVLVGRNTLTAANADELFRLARQPGAKLTIAAAGIGTSPHLTAELLQREANVRMTYVPYKGAPQIVSDLVGGHVDLGVLVLPGAMPHIKAGTVRVYGLVSPKRSPGAPEIPTLLESDSLRNMKPISDPWVALMVSSKTPAEQVRALSSALARVLATEEVQQQISKAGAVPMPLGSDEVQRIMRSDAGTFSALVKAAGIKAE